MTCIVRIVSLCVWRRLEYVQYMYCTYVICTVYAKYVRTVSKLYSTVRISSRKFSGFEGEGDHGSLYSVIFCTCPNDYVTCRVNSRFSVLTFERGALNYLEDPAER